MSPASVSAVEKSPTTVPAAAFSTTIAAERATSVGASLRSETAIVKVFSVESPPESVARTRIERAAAVSWSNTAAVTSDVPTIPKDALSASPLPATRA